MRYFRNLLKFVPANNRRPYNLYQQDEKTPYQPTFNLSPAARVSLCLSEPARSTRLSRDVLILATLFLLS